MNKNPTVDIVVPVYNEEEQLAQSVEKLRDFLIKNKFKYKYNIIIADNASTDNTLEIAKKLSKKYNNVKFIHLNQKGRGRALRKAWNDSNADIVSYMDVDLSTTLKAFPPMIDALVNGYDLATGSRLIEGAKIKRSLKREILSRGYNIILRFFLGIKFKDAQCGFKSVTRRVVNEVAPKVKDNEWFFDSELLFKAEKDGFRIKEIPVEWMEDPSSKVKLFKTTMNYLNSIMRLRFEFLKDNLYGIFKNPVLSNFVRNILALGQITTKNKIKRLIKDSNNIIEVGCGTGEFSKIINSNYVGVDIEKKHIDYANSKYSRKNKRFFIMNANKLNFKNKSFDTALMLSILHHLNDKDAISIMKEIKRVTKNKVILVDLIPLKYNIIGKFFYAMDLGNYIRPLDQQLELVSKVFKIQKVSRFRAGINIHSLVLCSIDN